MNRIFLLLSPLFLMTGCSVSADTQRGVEVLSSYSLDNALKETSGLFCIDGGAFSINDSGNKPELFTINELGKITGKAELDITNQDWETITGNEDYLYIGDIGNNAGKRKNLKIYRIDRKDSSKTEKLRFTYTGNKPVDNVPYAHDYDGEAMTMRDGKLQIFSKSWATETAHVYNVQDIKAKQALSPIANVEGLPGVVTGVDWSEEKQEYALVGYRSNALGMFKPFIATISNEYQVTGVHMLSQFAQVEGVCHAPNGNIWITQESSPYTSAKIAVLKIN